jgi:hypothetical protein
MLWKEAPSVQKGPFIFSGFFAQYYLKLLSYSVQQGDDREIRNCE